MKPEFLTITKTTNKTFTWFDAALNRCSVKLQRGINQNGEFATEEEAQEDYDDYLFSRF